MATEHFDEHDHSQQRLERLEKQRRRSQELEAIGRTAGGMAHDFNNLLTVINGYSEFLLDGLPERDPKRFGLEQIGKVGKQAAALTGQLMALSGRQLGAPTILDLNAILAEIEKSLLRLLGADIHLHLATAPDLARIKADRKQIGQVIMTLAVNARDAMPDGGQLTIETRNVDLDEAFAAEHFDAKLGPHVLLAVSDTGCGMDEATQARIFEPFFTTKGRGKGMGLGLATVYGVVKQSGGRIDVISEPGRGAAFKIYLPRVEAEAAPTLGDGPRAAETVLLVEDDDAVRTFSHMSLKRRGYRVLEARDRATMAGPLPPALGGHSHRGHRRQHAQHERRPTSRPTGVAAPRHQGSFLVGLCVRRHCPSGHRRPEHVLLGKPFSPDALARKVREVLDGV